jgi:kumamolisin
MPRTLLHCLKGSDHRKQVIKQIEKHIKDNKCRKLKIKIPDKKNPHCLEIVSKDKSKYAEKHSTLLKLFENNSDVALFADEPISQDKSIVKPKKRFKSHLRYATVKSKAIQSFTPTFLAKYYNYPPQQGTPPTIAIISLGGTYLTSDLNFYWTKVLGFIGKQIPTVTYVTVGGATNAPNQPILPNDGSDENTLDIEIIGGMCPGCKIVVYFATNSSKGFYDAIAAAIFDSKNKPDVISISWGGPEDSSPLTELMAYNQLFQLTRKPITVAAGDDGAGDTIVDGQPHVDFPAGSPYVIACGGTSVAPNGVETVWSWDNVAQSGTGGGISTHFLQPSYQANIVKYPIATQPSVEILFGNRGVPDISLNGNPNTGWTIYYQGKLMVNAIGGTSASAPAMAALIGRMNLPRPTLFNTSLYQAYLRNPSAFKDITVGNNGSIAGSTGVYSARVGYDFCTGLGSPNGTVLFNTLKTLIV